MKILLRLLPLACLLLGASLARAEPGAAIPTVAFIDVGQGDAILVRDGKGFDVLVDGGREAAGEAVLDHLRRVGVDDLEAIVSTHADSDHTGGLITVLNASDLPVESAWYNGYPGNTQTWANFVSAAAAEGLALLPLQYPAAISWGEAGVTVLNPEPGLTNPDQNEASVVLLIELGEIKTLLTADIDLSVEAELASRIASLQAEILKVAHHGSKYASGESFLAAVGPQEAVISVGPNPYGHPTLEAMSRLKTAGARLWRTDQAGTVTAVLDNTGYTMLPRLNYLPVGWLGMEEQ
jgi:beta-lactamase superfamily II metal-dependent hydrolase